MANHRKIYPPDELGSSRGKNSFVALNYVKRKRYGWRRILASLLPAYDSMYAAGWR